MSRSMKGLALLVCFLGAGWISSLMLGARSSAGSSSLVPVALEGSPFRRVWRPWPGREAGSQAYLGEASWIVDLAAAGSGSLFALSLPANMIGRLDADGTVGAEIEPTPNFGFAIDLEVDEAGRLLVLIANENRLARYRRDGTLIDSLDLEEPAIRVASLPGGRFVTLSRTSGDHLFCLYDAEGRLERRFGRVLEGAEQPAQIVQGQLASRAGAGFFYAPLYLGIVAGFDAGAQQRFMSAAVGPTLVPRAVKDSYGHPKVAPGSPYRTMDLKATRTHVWVLSEAGSKRDGRILDVYGAERGDYRFSYRLPCRPKSLAMAGDRLFTAEKNRITRWSMPADFDAL